MAESTENTSTSVMLRLMYGFLYPFSAAFRAISIYMQIVATTASISFPVGVGLVIAQEIQSFLPEDYWILINGSLLSLGLVPVLLTSIGKKAWNTLVDIVKHFKEADWQIFPSLEFPKAWKKSCDNIRGIPDDIRKYGRKGWKLAILAFLLTILITLVLSLGEPSPKLHDQYHVVVIGSEDLNAKEIKNYLFQGETVFSLTYLKNANATGEGICLNKSQQDWLDEFRSAITKCVEQAEYQEVPVLQVTGFSSSAPATPNDQEVNCEFANRRAKAVAAFLAGKGKEEWNCSDMENANAIGNASSLCATRDDWMEEAADGFQLKVRQWKRHADMVGGRPAYDGSSADGLTSAAELLNRSVHIEVPRDLCLVKEV